MKNRLPFAALTSAFTIAGAAIAFGLHDEPGLALVLVGALAVIGAFAAALSGDAN